MTFIPLLRDTDGRRGAFVGLQDAAVGVHLEDDVGVAADQGGAKTLGFLGFLPGLLGFPAGLRGLLFGFLTRPVGLFLDRLGPLSRDYSLGELLIAPVGEKRQPYQSTNGMATNSPASKAVWLSK